MPLYILMRSGYVRATARYFCKWGCRQFSFNTINALSTSKFQLLSYQNFSETRKYEPSIYITQAEIYFPLTPTRFKQRLRISARRALTIFNIIKFRYFQRARARVWKQWSSAETMKQRWKLERESKRILSYSWHTVVNKFVHKRKWKLQCAARCKCSLVESMYDERVKIVCREQACDWINYSLYTNYSRPIALLAKVKKTREKWREGYSPVYP